MVTRVVAFLPGYATDKARGLEIATIPGDRISDLVYSFAGFQQQGASWSPTFPEPHDTSPGKKHNVAQLIALKTRWPALNIVMSVGGWNHSHQGDSTFKTTPAFSAVSATPEARQAFVAACLDLFIAPTHPVIGPLFGGIDIDWEYPAGPDRHNITLLLQEFRSQLDTVGNQQGRHLTLSACWGAGAGGLELGTLAGTLDWFNLMTYLAHRPSHSPTNQVTDFGAPLFASPAEPPSNATWTIDGVVTSFLDAGVPAAKLVIGINTYARTYAGVADTNHGLYQPYTGPGPGSLGKSEALEYKDLMANYLPSYEYHWDDVAQCSFLYSPAEQIWMTYDSPQSIAARAAYADEKGLAGLLLWELSADAPSDLNASPPPTIPALIDAMPRGISGFAGKAILHETTDTSPSLAFQGGHLFLAARRPDRTQRLQVAISTNNAATFGGTLVSPETSDAAPALAEHNGLLMIAWKGSGNDNLSVAQVSLSVDAQGKTSITGLTAKTVLGQTSDASPAMVSHDGHLFLAWKGSGNDNLSVILSSDNGVSFSGLFISSETSDAAPALVSHDGRLLIAWKGSGNDNLSVAEIGLFGNTQGGLGVEDFRNKVVLGETSDSTPSIASDGRRLFLSWKGSGNDNLNVAFSIDGGATFGGKITSPETSDAAPALASDGSQVPIAWKGVRQPSLNTAQLAFF